MLRLLAATGLLVLMMGCATQDASGPQSRTVSGSIPGAMVPDWAADAVWYQIFPDRFRNGDPANDPTRETLELPIVPGTSWRPTSWTSDWYARDGWERELGPEFYESGYAVFHRRYGGDLQGVLDKLDYLDSLGVNALYFNPLFHARSSHKYDGNTFHHIDPYFGPDPEGDLAIMARETADPATWTWTRADSLFLRVLDGAKQRGMRVILDGVFNHSGRDFFAFQNLRENQQASPYKDWYIVRQWDDPATPENEFRYAGWWGTDTLPVFSRDADSTNLHPGPKQYIFDSTRRWMDPNGDGDPSDGIDGWRLDVADEVPVGFWAEWNAFVRDINPEAYTVGENWYESSAFIEQSGFSAVMNYHAFAYLVKGALIDDRLAPSAFLDSLQARKNLHGEAVQHAMQNLIDSHDTERVASMIVNANRDRPYQNEARWDYDWNNTTSPRRNREYLVRAPNAQEREVQRMIALLQMTFVGAPMLYYGTEAGIWGGDDPDTRKPMIWYDLEHDAEAADPFGRRRTPDPVVFDHALFAFHRDAIALRQNTVALRRGTFEPLFAQDEQRTYGFLRSYESQHAVVVFNRSGSAQSVRIPLPESARVSFRLALATRLPEQVRVQQDGEAVLLEVPARAGIVLVSPTSP